MTTEEKNEGADYGVTSVVVLAGVAALISGWLFTSGTTNSHRSAVGSALIQPAGTGKILSSSSRDRTENSVFSNVQKNKSARTHSSRSIAHANSTLVARVRPVSSKPAASTADDAGSAALKAQMAQLDKVGLVTLRARAYKALQAGDSQFAIQALVRAVKLNPNDGITRKYLAYALLSANDSAGALSQYLAYQKIQGAGLCDRLQFANQLASSSDKEPAKIFINHMITECAHDSSALELIAERCESMGLKTEAESAVVLGMKSTPDQQQEFRKLYRKIKENEQPVAHPTGELPHLT